MIHGRIYYLAYYDLEIVYICLYNNYTITKTYNDHVLEHLATNDQFVDNYI